MAHNSSFNLDSLVVNVRTAAIYAAFENSMFLGGGVVPVVNTPAGSDTIQVPLLNNFADGTVQEETAAAGWGAAGAFADDLVANSLTDNVATIQTKLIANRGIMRDTGGLSPALLGEQLGKSISRRFDNDLVAHFASFGGATNPVITGSGTSNALKTTDILKAKTMLMSNAISDDLVAILHPEQAHNIVNEIQTTAYAGGDVQSEALRRGYLGNLYGVDVMISSYVPVDESGADHMFGGIVMTKDAMRIAMQRNIQVEVARRPEAVGFDVVASLIANSGVVDTANGVLISSTGLTVET